jgi:hypothetical protein
MYFLGGFLDGGNLYADHANLTSFPRSHEIGYRIQESRLTDFRMHGRAASLWLERAPPGQLLLKFVSLLSEEVAVLWRACL